MKFFKLIAQFVALTTLIALPDAAVAGSGSGFVTKLGTSNTAVGALFFFRVSTFSGQPGMCNSGDWVIDPANALASEQMSLIKLAFALGTPVVIIGTESCTVSGSPQSAEVLGNIEL